MPTRQEMEARARQMAAERGLDPDFWAKVIAGESGWNPAARARTAKEDSGGLLQLNTKGGLGVEALRRGINPHDPTQWEQQLAYGFDYAKKHGHRPWTVARQLKGERTPGIPTNPVARGSSKRAAAPSTAAAPGPTSPLPDVGAPPAPPPDPFKAIIDAAKERQEQREKQQMAEAAAAAAAPQPEPPAPAPVAPPPPPVDYAGLLLPRIRRGLLADDYSLGLLGVP